VIPTSIRLGAQDQAADAIESPQAWVRLLVCLVIGAIGGVGMWSYVVALPAVQADFGVIRADASLPYTCLMIGFALDGILTGYLADRYGVAVPLLTASMALSLGYVATAFAGSLWRVALVHGALIGFGTSATFGPLVADISHWFMKRRGIAVALCALRGRRRRCYVAANCSLTR
jgi:MFS family permease